MHTYIHKYIIYIYIYIYTRLRPWPKATIDFECDLSHSFVRISVLTVIDFGWIQFIWVELGWLLLIWIDFDWLGLIWVDFGCRYVWLFFLWFWRMLVSFGWCKLILQCQKMNPKRSQNGSNIDSKWYKMVPIWAPGGLQMAQEVPGWQQGAPRGPQGGSKTSQDGPRRLQDGTKGAQDGPKMAS